MRKTALISVLLVILIILFSGVAYYLINAYLHKDDIYRETASTSITGKTGITEVKADTGVQTKTMPVSDESVPEEIKKIGESKNPEDIAESFALSLAYNNYDAAKYFLMKGNLRFSSDEVIKEALSFSPVSGLIDSQLKVSGKKTLEKTESHAVVRLTYKMAAGKGEIELPLMMADGRWVYALESEEPYNFQISIPADAEFQINGIPVPETHKTGTSGPNDNYSIGFLKKEPLEIGITTEFGNTSVSLPLSLLTEEPYALKQPLSEELYQEASTLYLQMLRDIIAKAEAKEGPDAIAHYFSRELPENYHQNIYDQMLDLYDKKKISSMAITGLMKREESPQFIKDKDKIALNLGISYAWSEDGRPKTMNMHSYVILIKEEGTWKIYEMSENGRALTWANGNKKDF